MIVVNWLERFWFMIGRFFGKQRYEFNNQMIPKGQSITTDTLKFTPEQIWFTAHNPRNVTDDWDRINMVRVLSINDGISIVADIKSGNCKVSWFAHA